jgi:hypothetical protein
MSRANESLRRFDELRDPLRRYLRCAGGSSADADDAVQEASLRLHLQNHGDGSFKWRATSCAGTHVTTVVPVGAIGNDHEFRSVTDGGSRPN